MSTTRHDPSVAEDAADGLVGAADIDRALDRLAGLVHRTPLLSSLTAGAWAERATGLRPADGRLYAKAEHLQKTGSFKARGMTNRIATLPADARGRGAITLSAGNAGQAYAWAGQAAGVPVTVVMPADGRASGASIRRHPSWPGRTPPRVAPSMSP